MLRLRGVPSNIEHWTAKSEVRVLTANMFTDDKKSGEKIGLEFFNLMKNDGVICKT
jgi:hypothetical protein